MSDDGPRPQLAVMTQDPEQEPRKEPHEHQPQTGTICTSGGLPVLGKLNHYSGYPVDAMCLVCGEPIRRERFFAIGPEGDWQLKPRDGER